jgi:hypothetical protein
VPGQKASAHQQQENEMQLLKLPITWIILLAVVLSAIFTGFAIANPEATRIIARFFFELLWMGLFYVMGIKFLYFLLDTILGTRRD